MKKVVTVTPDTIISELRGSASDPLLLSLDSPLRSLSELNIFENVLLSLLGWKQNSSGLSTFNSRLSKKGLNMKTLFAATLTLSVCFAFAGVSDAQQTQTRQGNFAAAVQPSVVKKVGFRMANWRTVHGDGTKATADLVKTLKEIGCEVKQDNHGGHTDISFRSPSWKTVSVRNDDESNQWHQWLVNNEFETVVLNPPATTQLPTVKVRMANWKTIHAQSSEQAQSLKETYELIGCEAVVDNHGDHIDLKFRSPNWSTIGLVNSQAAHVWQDWLNKSGFETQHDHSADGHDAHAGHDHGATGHEGHDHAKGDHSGHNH